MSLGFLLQKLESQSSEPPKAEVTEYLEVSLQLGLLLGVREAQLFPLPLKSTPRQGRAPRSGEDDLGHPRKQREF